MYGVKCRDGLNNLPISTEKIKTIRTEEELEILLSSNNDTEEKMEDLTNNNIPDENSTSTENEMAVEKRSGMFKVSPPIIFQWICTT